MASDSILSDHFWQFLNLSVIFEIFYWCINAIDVRIVKKFGYNLDQSPNLIFKVTFFPDSVHYGRDGKQKEG